VITGITILSTTGKYCKLIENIAELKEPLNREKRNFKNIKVYYSFKPILTSGVCENEIWRLEKGKEDIRFTKFCTNKMDKNFIR
jgi:hypothetical protein